MRESEVNQLNGLALAYIGDAVYELFIRKKLLQTGEVKPQQLHQKAIQYVSGRAQATVVLRWLKMNELTEEEERIVKRGRNAKSHSIPKNIDVKSYRYSSGFEALIGYHYLLGHEERLEKLLQHAMKWVDERNGRHE